MNAGINLLISGIVSGISWLYDELANANKHAIEEGQAVEDDYKDKISTGNSNISTLKSIKAEYDQLSAGVDNNGNNISLSTSEYQKFLELRNQILETTPSLIDGYDAEGNAIARNNGLIDEAIKKQEKKVQKAQEERVNDVNFDKITKKYIAQYKDAEGTWKDKLFGKDLESQKDNLLTPFYANPEGQKDFFKKAKEVLGHDVNPEDYNDIAQIAKHFGDIFDKLDKSTTSGLNKDKYLEYAQNIVDRSNQMTEAIKQAREALGYIPQSIKGFNSLNAGQQGFINNITDQWDIDEKKFSSKNGKEYYESIKKQIEAFTKKIVDDPSLQTDVSDLVKISSDTSDKSAAKWEDQIKSKLKNLQNSTGLDQETIAIGVGLELDPDGNVLKDGRNIQEMIDDINKRFDNTSKAKEWTDSLSMDELSQAFEIVNNKAQIFTGTLDQLKSRIKLMDKSKSVATWEDYEAATQTSNPGAKYLAIKEAYETQKQAYDNGLTGTDDFKKFTSMTSKTGKDTEKAFEQASIKMKRYFTEDGTGLDNFLDDMEAKQDKIGTDLFKFSEKGDKVKISIKDMAKTAKEFGIGLEPLEAMLNRLKDYNFDVQFDSEIEKYNEANGYLDQMTEKYKELDDTNPFKEQYGKEIEDWRQKIIEAQQAGEAIPDEWIKELRLKVTIDDYKAKAEQAVKEAKSYVKQGNYEKADESYSTAISNQDFAIQDIKDKLKEEKIEIPVEYKDDEKSLESLYKKLSNETDDKKRTLIEKDIEDAQNTLIKAYEKLLSGNEKAKKESNGSASSKEITNTSKESISSKKVSDSTPDYSTDHQQADNNFETVVVNYDPDTSEVDSESERIEKQKLNSIVDFSADTGAVESATVKVTQPDGKVIELTAEDLATKKIDGVKRLKINNKTFYIYANDKSDTVISNIEKKTIASKRFNIVADVTSNMPSYMQALFLHQGTAHVKGTVKQSALNRAVSRAKSDKKQTKEDKKKEAIDNITNGGLFKTKKKVKVNGSAHAQGTIPKLSSRALAMGTLNKNFEDEYEPLESIALDYAAFAKGDWGLKKNETALTGELGQELVVRGNRWFTVGDNGAEFAKLKAGDIVFNHLQTKEILSKGYTNGRAKAYASGTAYASSTASGKRSNLKKSSSSSKKKSSSSSKKKSSAMTKTLEKLADLYDWIEVKLQRLEEATNRWIASAEISDSVTSSIKNYNSALKSVNTSISSNSKAQNKYKAQAKSVAKKTKLPKSLQTAVQQGRINKSTIKNYSENTQKKIEEYKKWYDKAVACKDAVAELKKQQKDLVNQKLDSILNWYDAFIDKAKTLADYHEVQLSYNEAIGHDTSGNRIWHYKEEKKDLNSVLSNQQSQLSKYQSEYNASKKYLNNSEKSEYEKAIQDLKNGILETKTSMAELDNKIREINLEDLNKLADAAANATKQIEQLASISTTHGNYEKESDLQAQLQGNIKERDSRLDIVNKIKEQMLHYEYDTTKYNELKDKLNDELNTIKEIEESNEQLRQDIINLRFDTMDRIIEDRNVRIDDNRTIIDLMGEDNLFDEETGKITTNGQSKIALLNDSIAQSQKNLADYYTEMEALEELYKNGQIGEKSYTEKMIDLKQSIQDTASETHDLNQELIGLGKEGMQAEIDALLKVIDKRKEALSRKKEYNDYDRNIKDQNKNLQALEAERAALEGVEGAAAAAQRAKLDAQIAEAKDQLEQTKLDHSYGIQVQGYDDLAEKLQESLDKQVKLLSSSLETQAELIKKLLDGVADNFADVFTNINSIIKNNGINGTTTKDFQNDYKNQSTGASTNSSNSSITQNTSNQNTSINGTTGINTGNNINTQNISTGGTSDTKAPTESQEKNRSIVSFSLSWSGGNLNYNTSKTISVTNVIPPDAQGQTYTWKTSNSSIISISSKSGNSVTIKNCNKTGKNSSSTITCTSANGIAVSITVNAVYTKGQQYALSKGCTIGKKAVPSAATLKTYSPLNKYLVSHGFDTLRNPDQMKAVGKKLGVITTANSKKGKSMYPGKDKKYSTAQSTKILNALKKNGLRQGGVVDDFIPISQLNSVVRKNGDEGIATVRRDELLTNPEGTVKLLEAMQIAEQLTTNVKKNGKMNNVSSAAGNCVISYDALIKVESGGMIDKSVLNELKGLVKTAFEEEKAIKLKEYHKTGWKPKF